MSQITVLFFNLFSSYEILVDPLCPVGIKQKTCLQLVLPCLCVQRKPSCDRFHWEHHSKGSRPFWTCRCLGHSLELLAGVGNMTLGRSFMLLKSELLTATHGAQGYHPAYTNTPSYHPQPAVHRVFWIGKFVPCSDVPYLLTTEWGKMITMLIP